MSQIAMSNRFRNMSVLCAFLVAVIHCRPSFAAGTGSWWVKQMLESGICLIAVPFFFVASGFFLAGHFDEDGWHKREFSKRIRTLLVPYVIWITLFLCYKLCTSFADGHWYGNSYFSLKSLLKFYGVWWAGCPGLSPLWYVRALLILVAVSPVLLRLLRMGKGVWLVILFVLYGALCPGPHGVGYIVGLMRVGVLPLAGFFYFSLGMAVRMKIVKVDLRYGKWMLAVGVCLLFCQAYFYYLQISWAQYWGWLAIPFMLWGVYSFVPDCVWPKWLTMSAFPVFLIHKFFLNPLTARYLGGRQTLVSYAATAIFIFAAAILVTLVIRRFAPRFAVIAFGGR